MLEKLRRIVLAVGATANLDEALETVVARVKDAMAVDVCSVYLAERGGEGYVLRATVGLNTDAVNRVRLSRDEGLVGLVGSRHEPVNLEDAFTHAAFRYFPETGEERYHAFLGVPIIHYRRLLGVLVVQQGSHRRFDEEEVAFLVTIAAQLAGTLLAAAGGGAVTDTLDPNPPDQAGFIQGIRGSPGIALGTIVSLRPEADLSAVPDRAAEGVGNEVAAFRRAIDEVRDELKTGGERMGDVLAEDARLLFDAYVMLLSSESLAADTVRRIEAGAWAPAALRDTIGEHARVFDQMEDDYLRTRGEDIRDIGRRILMRLQSSKAEPRIYPDRSILLGEQISVAQLADLPVERLVGIVCTRGSGVSHLAVLANALGIPSVMGLGDLAVSRLDGKEIIVDGYGGRVCIEPARPVRREFQRLQREEGELNAGLAALRDLPAETPDGQRVSLHVNTGLLADIRPALKCGADGVGLYRTEFPFMVRQSFPGEDEQYRIYRQVLDAFHSRAVVMRTLDVGGDKPLSYLPVEEENPSLGWRGIRFTLDHPEIFLTQLRAMLRAAQGVDALRILLPMVSQLGEVDEAQRLLHQACEELLEEGIAVTRPLLGVMVEVPSLLFQVDALARRVDFLSLGTNDLTQYLLAVDRNNSRVAALYDHLHPALVIAIRRLVFEAREHDLPLSVCGEMAGDPAAVILLLAMGIDSLSMSSSRLPGVKWLIRTITRARAEELLDQVLTLEDAAATRRLLDAELEASGLGGLVRAGK